MKNLDIASQSCRKCRLYKTRTNVVNYDGDPESPLAFIGEGPGKEEDETGKPFVGRAGKKLTTCLNMLGVDRDKVLIFNIIKCRPPNNRKPKSDEVDACIPYLQKQLKVCKNLKVMIALGHTSWFHLAGKDEQVTRFHGSVYKTGGHKYIYAYHPSYLARKNDISLTKEFLEDVKLGMKLSKYRKWIKNR